MNPMKSTSPNLTPPNLEIGWGAKVCPGCRRWVRAEFVHVDGGTKERTAPHRTRLFRRCGATGWTFNPYRGWIREMNQPTEAPYA